MKTWYLEQELAIEKSATSFCTVLFGFFFKCSRYKCHHCAHTVTQRPLEETMWRALTNLIAALPRAVRSIGRPPNHSKSEKAFSSLLLRSLFSSYPSKSAISGFAPRHNAHPIIQALVSIVTLLRPQNPSPHMLVSKFTAIFWATKPKVSYFG